MPAPAAHLGATVAGKNMLGWWKETAEASSEDEIKPIDWLVPVS